MDNLKKAFSLFFIAAALLSVPGLYVSADNPATPRCPDVNGDNKINILDLIVVRNALYTGADTSNWLETESRDVNGDDLVNMQDLYDLRDNLGVTNDDNLVFDVNVDGKINILDLILVRNALGSMSPDVNNSQWDPRKDATGDNKITTEDLYYIRNYLNQNPEGIDVCKTPTQSQPQNEPAPIVAQSQPESQPQGNAPTVSVDPSPVSDEKPILKMSIRELQAKIAELQMAIISLLGQLIQALKGQIR